jgi:hypothetical protein
MTHEGIVESSPATVIKRTPVDFNIDVPIVGTGDELGTQVSRVSGVHRSKYVTHDGDVIKEYDDELDYQDLTPLKGSATEQVLKQKEAKEQKSLLQKIAGWLHRDHIALQEKVDKAQENDARRDYQSSVEAKVEKMAWERVRKSSVPTTVAQATADIWIQNPELVQEFENEREQRLRVAAHMHKFEKQMPLETENRNLGDANIVDNLNDPKEILEELTQRIQDTAADGGEKITYEVAYSRAVQTPAGKAAMARLNANRVTG